MLYLALRLLSKLHSEFEWPLHVSYLDIKAVFDSFDRTALWLTLSGKDSWYVVGRLVLEKAAWKNT